MRHLVGCAARTMGAPPNLPVRTAWGGPAHPTRMCQPTELTP
jgi:hypothetical protein